MSVKSLRQRITSMNGINIPDADYLRVPAGEIRAAIAEVAVLVAKYNELLVALHSVGSAIGIEKADRSPYSIACGVLVMANKLAAMDANPDLSWRNAIITEVERVHRIGPEPMPAADLT